MSGWWYVFKNHSFRFEALVHADQTKLIFDQLGYILNGFQKYSMINFQSFKAVLTNLDYYYYWQIIETLTTVIVCTVSLGLIKNICNSTSVVWKFLINLLKKFDQ